MPKGNRVAPGFWWDADNRVGYADFRVGGRKGRRVRAAFSDVSYREALRLFGELRDKEKESPASSTSLPSLESYWKEYGRLRSIKDSTREDYGGMLKTRVFPELGALRIDRITPARLLEFRSKLLTERISPATINRHLGLVRMLLNEARLRGLLRSHPVPPGAVPPLKEPEVVVAYLSPSERKALLEAFDDEEAFRARLASNRHLGPVKVGRQSPEPRRYGGGPRADTDAPHDSFERFRAAKPLFLCALDSGLSRSDLIGLSWHQVDLEGRTIRTSRTKTGTPVVMPMTNRLHEALATLQNTGPHDPVFRTHAGGRWSEVILKRYFTIAKELARIERPFRFHDMRHDFASALAQEGVSLFVIAQLLGHTSTRMTMRYAHLHPENLRAAIDALPGR